MGDGRGTTARKATFCSFGSLPLSLAQTTLCVSSLRPIAGVGLIHYIWDHPFISIKFQHNTYWLQAAGFRYRRLRTNRIRTFLSLLEDFSHGPQEDPISRTKKYICISITKLHNFVQ
jgi:hypothetical protein